jgi:hypothetical protein
MILLNDVSLMESNGSVYFLTSEVYWLPNQNRRILSLKEDRGRISGKFYLRLYRFSLILNSSEVVKFH